MLKFISAEHGSDRAKLHLANKHLKTCLLDVWPTDVSASFGSIYCSQATEESIHFTVHTDVVCTYFYLCYLREQTRLKMYNPRNHSNTTLWSERSIIHNKISLKQHCDLLFFCVNPSIPQFSALPPVRVVFSITMEGSARKVITVRSALMVKNRLDVPMEVRLDSPSAPDSKTQFLFFKYIFHTSKCRKICTCRRHVILKQTDL